MINKRNTILGTLVIEWYRKSSVHRKNTRAGVDVVYRLELFLMV
jgi:hypothetical protein